MDLIQDIRRFRVTCARRKVARTIADLAGRERIASADLYEALRYRLILVISPSNEPIGAQARGSPLR